MKIALISIFFVATAVLSVSATSPPQCAGITCDPSTCEVLDCRCGSYKGYCGCCDYCRTCPNEECTALFQDTCSEGYRCVLDDAERSFDNGGTGHCRANRG
ncbi:8.6 kDa transglutaminase substrate-like [Dermacentor variabilis]|uniref:8.6 kDa transglutaminase substrate-like n=1 Tax=Dermacentor variabilis TaxID=34621 RepID=UPI003F5C4871